MPRWESIEANLREELRDGAIVVHRDPCRAHWWRLPRRSYSRKSSSCILSGTSRAGKAQEPAAMASQLLRGVGWEEGSSKIRSFMNMRKTIKLLQHWGKKDSIVSAKRGGTGTQTNKKKAQTREAKGQQFFWRSAPLNEVLNNARFQQLSCDTANCKACADAPTFL